MADYPSEIKDTDFKDADDKRDEQRAIPIVAERSAVDLTNKNAVDTLFCSIEELWIESLTTARSCHKSFDKYETIASASDQANRFHFVPLLEDLKVHWKFTGYKYIKTAELELFRNVDGNAHKLWAKKIVWEIGKCPELGETPFNGDLADLEPLKQAKDAKEVAITDLTLPADFPYKSLTVEHSPYMLRLSIKEATAHKKAIARWLFLDVLVHSIELDWGAQTRRSRPDVSSARSEGSVEVEVGAHLLLPQDRPDIMEDSKHVDYKAKVLSYEKNILSELKNANARPDTAGVVHKVILDSNLFAVAGKGETNEEATKDADFKEYKALWEDGPRIPLLAKVYLLKSDNSSTKSDNSPADVVKAAKALGNSRLLWDWADNAPPRWKEPLDAGATAKAEPFLDQAYNQYNRPSLPTNSCNCPADLGGKRGDDNAKIFPRQDGTDPFGFKVDPCGNRKWSSYSSFGKDASGNPTNATGVIFQPARQAGDTYAIIAYLDFVQKPDAVADIQAAPALQSIPAKFKGFRRVKVHYMVRGTNANLGCDPAQLQTALERLYLKEVDMILDVARTHVNNTEYIKALKSAIDEVEQEDGPLSAFYNLPLLFRNLIDTNPPDDSPAICLHPRNVFLTNLEQQFQSSRLRVMYERTDKSPQFNEVVGKTSGAKGQLLTSFRCNPDDAGGPGVRDLRYLALLPGAGPDFSAQEEIESRTGKNNGKQTNTVTVEPIKSSWGHSVTPEEDNSKTHEEAISVVINGTTTAVKYDKSFSRKLKDELSEKEKEKLRQALRTAGTAQNESQPMVIKLRGRIHSAKAETKRAKGVEEDQIADNAAERMRKLVAFIEDQFRQFVVADRKAVYQRFITEVAAIDTWREIQPDVFKQHCQSKITEWLFVPIILNYVALTNRGAEGVLLMHVPGRTNTPLLPQFKDTGKELRVTGGFYPDGTGKRSTGVVYLSTVTPEVALQIPTRTPESIISHEVAHSLFLPHTESTLPGGKNPPMPYKKVHIAGDDCMMNYDLDSRHFCGMCMIRLRGWKWEPRKEKPVPEQWEYKVELELDDIDTLFDNPANPLGQMERLQALGLLNHPLRHQKANDCLSYSMEHARRLGLFAGTNVAALKPPITQFLMERGALPNPGQFARMRLPKNNILYSQGMMKTMFPEDFNDWGTPQEKEEQQYSEKFMLGADPYEVDQLYFKDNPTLGKIPLKVIVKKRIINSGQPWPTAAIAPDVAVYFKLISPNPLPPYAANPPAATPLAGGNSYYDQVTAAPLRAEPEANLKPLLEKKAPGPNDPDGKNAPAEVGGKRVGGNTANVFCGARTEGFGPVSQSTAGGHEYGARVLTDQTGTARICFSPSTVGGDTYKLRVYVGPPTQQKNGQPLGDDAVETGTMVRWRTVRISHYIQMPPPTSAADLPAELRARTPAECEHPEPKMGVKQTGRVCTQCLLKYGNMPPVDLKSSLTLELAKAYNQLILEPAALAPVSLSALGPALLNEIGDLLTNYPTLNSLYWARFKMKNNPELNPVGDWFGFPLTKVPASADKVYSAILPHFDVAMDGAGKARVIAGKFNLLNVAEPAKDNRKGTNILTENTGDGILKDAGVVPGGAAGVIDYNTGQLRVTFNQPQGDKRYSAWYFPTDFLDFRSLLYFPAKSPFLFNLRMPNDYNTQVGHNGSGVILMDAAADPPKGRVSPRSHLNYVLDRDSGAVKILLMMALGRAVTRYPGVTTGYCPGLVFVRALALDTYEGVWGDGTQEGKSVGSTIYVFGGGGAPPACGLAPLTMHETSHGLYMFHAAGGTENFKAERHDTNYTCVMSYANNNGDYCGKCNASMRGMKIN